jgi:hypothetical protein
MQVLEVFSDISIFNFSSFGTATEDFALFLEPKHFFFANYLVTNY